MSGPDNSTDAICVFCGSRSGNDPSFAVEASRLGGMLAERGIRLVYGGGDIGLMGVVVRAVLDGGGKATGVIPKFLLEYEVGNPDVDEFIAVETMHERKAIMFDRSDAFVVLPGGIGTLDETIEITTWKQLRQHAKPIIIVNIGGCWDSMINLFDSVIDAGFAHSSIKELITVVDSVDEVFEAIASAPEPKEETITSHF
ncbi:MAG: TIGR00730 family Rossman fold protein [Rhodospirillaceae bacterium]|nr:TIGR00730 family Rossman fold protein [Rhodospirillaceae bacterium]